MKRQETRFSYVYEDLKDELSQDNSGPAVSCHLPEIYAKNIMLELLPSRGPLMP